MIIEHRNDVTLTNTNYFSWLRADLCFYPLQKDYIQQLTLFGITAQHQWSFRLRQNTSPDSAAHASTCLSKPYRDSHLLALQLWSPWRGFSASLIGPPALEHMHLMPSSTIPKHVAFTTPNSPTLPGCLPTLIGQSTVSTAATFGP
jgi:hypothetical protein